MVVNGKYWVSFFYGELIVMARARANTLTHRIAIKLAKIFVVTIKILDSCFLSEGFCLFVESNRERDIETDY
jgi:hypothetical protein